MPDVGMLLWRSPDGTIGLCIITNLKAMSYSEESTVTSHIVAILDCQMTQ